MTIQNAAEVDATQTDVQRDSPLWLRATIEDAKSLDFEAPIKGSTAADSHQLSDQFRAVLPPADERSDRPDTAAARVFSMLSAVAGIRLTPENRNEPFAPMAVLADGRRSPVPEDFRGGPLEVLAYMAERAAYPVLRARLSDVSWLLDRKRGQIGALAVSSYIEIVRKIDNGDLKLRFNEEGGGGALTHGVRDYLRRALQIGRAIGREKLETLAARDLVIELRKRANDLRVPIVVHWFSELDLDFGLTDAADVAADIEGVLKALPADTGSHMVVELWRLAARAYRIAKNDEEARRCRAEAAECLVAEAEAATSAMVASHHLAAAIAELHGVSGKKDRRTELRHRLVDMRRCSARCCSTVPLLHKASSQLSLEDFSAFSAGILLVPSIF